MIRLRAIAAAVAVVCASAVGAAQAPQAAETFDAAWTIIKNTHFDKTMNGLNWDAVRDELRPRAAAAKTPAELRIVIRDMLGRLGLSHFALIPSGPEAMGDGKATSGDAGGEPGIDVRQFDEASGHQRSGENQYERDRAFGHHHHPAQAGVRPDRAARSRVKRLADLIASNAQDG